MRCGRPDTALGIDTGDLRKTHANRAERTVAPDARRRRQVWSVESDGELVALSKDPGSFGWTRLVWGLMQIFPFENEL